MGYESEPDNSRDLRYVAERRSISLPQLLRQFSGLVVRRFDSGFRSGAPDSGPDESLGRFESDDRQFDNLPAVRSHRRQDRHSVVPERRYTGNPLCCDDAHTGQGVPIRAVFIRLFVVFKFIFPEDTRCCCRSDRHDNRVDEERLDKA